VDGVEREHVARGIPLLAVFRRRPSRRRPARILYCETNVDGTIGGSYYSLLYLVKALDRTQYEPLVVFYTRHSLLPAFAEAGVATLIWPKHGRFTFGARVPSSRPWLRVPLMALQRTLNIFRGFLLPTMARMLFLVRHRIDLVHLNNSILYNHDWMLAARLVGRKCVSHERGINAKYGWAARYFGRRLDAIICISDAVKENMCDRGAHFDNLNTIHNGFDPAAVRHVTDANAIRASLDIEPGAGVVVMVGNFKSWKGQETLVRAMATVSRSYAGVHCVLVGDTAPADRQYEADVRALIAALNLDKRVSIVGFRSDVPDLLRLADVVVHASTLPEPFGRVVLEAMACRKPVIGSRAGGVTEIIEDGVTGLLFPAGDDKALSGAIIELLGDRTSSKRMGEAGYERLVSHFHLDQNVVRTQQLYEKLLPYATPKRIDNTVLAGS
jgi:glycosyltransferase involved in cell wall biosynthesis